MANIQEVAEELCRLTAKEVNELSQVMKSEYGIEPAACIDREIERRRIKECTSPKEYGMALMQRRQQKQARRRNK